VWGKKRLITGVKNQKRKKGSGMSVKYGGKRKKYFVVRTGSKAILGRFQQE